jgi:hypothetical protein
MAYIPGKGYSEDHKDSFLIQINEQQREFIEKALRNYNPPVIEPEDKEELDTLHSLFEELPNQENTFIREDGKRDLLIHGFCL